jgi:hypothetical protein
LLRAAYAPVADEPIPDRILAAAGADRGSSAAGSVIELDRRRGSSPRFFVPVSLAAGIALAVGVALGVSLAPSFTDSESLVAGAGTLEPGSSLHDALQTLPSGATSDLGGGIRATARLTFQTTDGSYCRQIDLVGSKGTTATLACRAGGDWRVDIATFSAAPPQGNTDEVYRPASGIASALDAAIDEIIAGEPLGRDAENALIGRGWTSDPP